MQRPLLLAAFAFFPAAVLGACGSRGPLDDVIVTGGGADAGTLVDAAIDQHVPVDAAPPVVDAGFDAGTGLIQCGTCVAQQCGTDVTTCLGDAACRAIFQCVATTCFGLGGGGGGGGGGGIDPTCLLGCTSGGGSGVGEALGVFQCITGDCGQACGGLLGGLGGLGGGIPTPAPPRAPTPAQRRAIFVEAFSAWPELTCADTENARATRSESP